MLTYTIEDPISPDLTRAVEVVVEVGGRKRWCFFATPRLLERVGDFVPGTRVRVHPGVPHMIVVSELTEEIVGRVLRDLLERGALEAHTLLLEVGAERVRKDA